MTTKRIIKIIFLIIISIILSFFITPIPILIAFLIYNKWYNSKNHIEYDKNKICKDSKIIDVKTKVCGLKFDHKYRTVVTFDDGFRYISHDTHIVNSKFLNVYTQELTLTNAMRDTIIDKAIDAHYNALGLKRPQKPRHTRCGKCNYEGWYTNNCPECNSSIKIYLND